MEGFSGPILAVSPVDDCEDILVGTGPYIFLKSGAGSKILVGSLPNIVHGFSDKSNEPLVIFGGKYFWVPEWDLRIQTKDWMLGVSVCDDFIFAAVMHNRVEVYHRHQRELITTVACPTHALLYSGLISATNDDSKNIKVTVHGGGVMCDLHFWSFRWNVQQKFADSLHSRVVRKHKGSIFRIRPWPSRGLVLTTSDDRSVCLWKGTDTIQEFKGHLARVWDAVPIGDRFVATACEDSLIRVFDSETGNLVDSLHAHRRDVRCLASDGKNLFSGGEDGYVYKWSFPTISRVDWMLPTTIPENDWIRGVHIVNGDVSIVTNFGKILSMNSGECIAEGLGIITCSEIVESRFLFVGTSTGDVSIHDLESKIVKVVQQCVPVRAVSILPYREGAIVANPCGDIAFVSNSGIEEKQTKLVRHSGTGGKLLSLCSIGLNVVVLGDDKGFLYTVNTEQGKCLSNLLIARSDKCVSIERVGDSGSVLVNLSTGSSVQVHVDKSGGLSIGSTKKLANASYVLSTTPVGCGFTSTDFVVFDSTCIQFRHNCGGHRRPFDYSIDNRSEDVCFVYGKDNRCVTVVNSRFRCKSIQNGCNGDLIHSMVSCNGLLFTANEDNGVRVISNDMRVTDIMERHEGSVRAIARVDDIVVSGGARSQIVCSRMNVATGSLVPVSSVQLPGDTDMRVMDLAGMKHGPDYRFLALTSCSDIYIVDIMGDSMQERLCPSIAEISKSVCLSVCYVGDERFVIGAGNGIVCLVNPEGAVIRTARIHQSGINSMTLSACGRFIITGGDDQAIAVIDLNLSVISFRANASSCSIRAVACCPRTGIIYSTGTDRLLSQWKLDGHRSFDLISRASLPITDPLSLEVLEHECSIAVGGRGLVKIKL
jgi:WD40 repeat protein